MSPNVFEPGDGPDTADTRRTTVSSAQHESPQLQVPGLTLLYHPDAERWGDRVPLPQLMSGRPVSLSRLDPRFVAPQDANRRRPLDEPHLSRTPILLSLDDENLVVERGAHRGKVFVDFEPLGERFTAPSSRLEKGLVIILSSYVALLFHRLDPVPSYGTDLGLIGHSAAMDRLRREIRRVAELPVPVLLRGETGTGKELVAGAVHAHSPRAPKPCLTVNMAAIPASLAASELFGSAKGAFTGATRDRKGFFEQADGGTLFLDEIGETPPDVQALLLRALESSEIQPVGSTSTRRVDIRVLAATDADLEAAIRDGTFKAPLRHRLAGYEIRLPALRDRPDDIPRLLRHFLVQEQHDLRPDAEQSSPARLLSCEGMTRLVVHAWPGNVRELKNAARRLAVLGPDAPDLAACLDELTADTEAEEKPAARPSVPPPQPQEAAKRRYRKPAEVSQAELLEALQANDWNLRPTAEALGISRASLYQLIDDYKIPKASELGAPEIEAARAAVGGRVVDMARYLKVSSQGLRRRMTQLGL